jgi:hypothetical protein
VRDTLAPRTTPPEAAPAASAPFGRHRPLVVALWATWLPLGLVGFGMVVRIRQYVFNRSLWLDEGMIAGNIINRSYGELLQPLADHQGAPVGWLWLQRTMVLALGDGERALRLVPLVAGVAVLLVALKVARALLPGWLLPVAVAFVAVSPFLIRYSNEAKQYQTDVLAGLVLLALSLPLVVGPLDRRRLAIWSVVAAVAIWFSHPTVFFIAGFTAVLVAVRLARRDWSSLAALAVACLPWAASLLANHYWFLRRLGGDDKLLRYFERGFPPEPASPVGMVAWLADRWEAFVRAPLGMGKAAVVAVLVLAGLVALIRAAPAQTGLLIAPVLLLIAAAVLRRYPLEGRLLLALVPIALLVVVAAADWGWRRGVVATVAGLIALGALLIPITANSVAMTRRPTHKEELRPVLQEMRSMLRPGDRVLVDTGARPAFTYYAARLGLHGDAVVSLGRRPGDCDDRRALARLAAGQRVWAVFSHRLLATPRDNQLRIHAQLLGYGPRVASVRSRGARADLYDPAALTSTTQAARPVAPGVGCLLLGPIPPAQPGGQA